MHLPTCTPSAQGIEYGDAAGLGEGVDEILVVSFNISESNVEAFITCGFRRISVRFVTRHFRDRVLVVTQPTSTEGKVGPSQEFDCRRDHRTSLAIE